MRPTQLTCTDNDDYDDNDNVSMCHILLSLPVVLLFCSVYCFKERKKMFLRKKRTFVSIGNGASVTITKEKSATKKK